MPARPLCSRLGCTAIAVLLGFAAPAYAGNPVGAPPPPLEAAGEQRLERQSDSVLNGALIGAGVAVAAGLFFCTRTEPWENCRDDVGPMLRIGAIGAGIGIAIDALIRKRKPASATVPEHLRLYVAPAVARGAGSLSVALRF